MHTGLLTKVCVYQLPSVAKIKIRVIKSVGGGWVFLAGDQDVKSHWYITASQ